MASSDELSPSKVRKKLKLRRDRALVDTSTHDSLNQNGQSTSRGLLRNGCSPSKKRKSTASPRRRKDLGSGRKPAAGKVKGSLPVETPPHSPPASDDDCVVISDSDNVDSAPSVMRPHVKVSIKQSPCSASAGSWQQHSGSRSSAGYSDFGTGDDTVEHEVVGTYGKSRFEAAPMFANDDLPDLAPDSSHSEALNTESSSGDIMVVDQGGTLRKRYLKTKQSSSKSLSNKSVTTKRGKTAPPCKRCIIPPVPSKSSSSLETSNDVLSSSETATAWNDCTPSTSNTQNNHTDPFTIELSSSDECITSMYDEKKKRPRKRHLQHGPSDVESSSDEPVTSKDKDSPSKPQSPHCKSRFLLSLRKGGQTLNLSCRLNPDVSPEDARISEHVDQDGSTDSDEPLTSVVKRKIMRMRMQAGVVQPSSDASANSDNDASLGLPVAGEDHACNKRKEDDDSERSNIVTPPSDPDITQMPSVSECLPSSPNMPNTSRRPSIAECQPSSPNMPNASRRPSIAECQASSPDMPQLSREMEDDEVLVQGIDDNEQPKDLEQSGDIMPSDKSSVCNDIGPCDDHNTNDSLPLIGSSSETGVVEMTESRTVETQSAVSLGKQKMEVRLTDFMICKCAECSSIQGRFRTQRNDITTTTTDGHSGDKTALQPPESMQVENVFDLVKRRNRHRNFFVDFAENLNNISACLVQPQGKDTTSLCQEHSMNSALSTAEVGNNLQEMNASKGSTTDCDVTGDLEQQVNGETATGEKHLSGALSEVGDVPPSVGEVRSTGHVSDDDTAVDNVPKSKDDVGGSNDDMEMIDVTESKCDNNSNNSDGDDSRRGVDDGSDDDANDREGDADMSGAVFSQQDDDIVLLSDYDENDDSVFANPTQLSCIKSEPTSESEQETEADITEIPEEGLRGSPDLIGKEVGVGRVLGEVFIPVKSEPNSDMEQDLYDARPHVPAREQLEVKTKPLEERGKSVELTSETVPSGVRTGGLTEDVTASSGDRPEEEDRDVTSRDAVQEHQEERAPGGSTDQPRIRAAALSSILQSFEKRTKSRRQHQAVKTDTEPCQQEDNVNKPCQSRQAVGNDTEPCLQGDTALCVTKPCQSCRIVDTTTELSHLHDTAEPWPAGETPSFSDDDTSTTDEQETTETSEDNTFLVLSTAPKPSFSGTRPTSGKQPLTPKRRKVHHSPIRARRLSPLKANVFYPRRRNSVIPPKKVGPGRSVSVPKLNSLTWATNRKRRMALNKERITEQLLVQDVRKAQKQMKDREVMQKKILARAKSASVQQRFTSRSEALLQDMTRASAKPLPSNSSKKTTEPAKEQISRPPAEASTANASVSEHSVPPGGKSSTQRPVAPPSAQRTNCAPQKSVLPSVSERRLCEVRMPAPQTVSSRTLSKDADFLLPILRWNPCWLNEQKRMGDRDPPVEGDQRVWPLVDSYDSFNDYMKLFKPLLLLETWKSVHRDWMEKRLGCEREMNFVTGNFFTKHKYIDLVYEGVLTREREKASPPLLKNDLIILDLRLASQRPDRKSVFALVLKVCKISPHDRRETLHPQTAKAAKSKDSVVTRVTVRLYYRDYRIDKTKMMKVTVFTSLSTALRQFVGLTSLSRSSLCRDILRPVNEQVFRSSLPDRTIDPLLQSQQRVAQSAAECVLGPPILPRICLIQGPPGTGKTTTIIDIISRILSSTKENSSVQRPKVLLCTPSNAAIDELTRRLIQKRERKESRRQPLQLVRVGVPVSMAADVSAYSLDALAKHRIQEEAKSTGPASCPSSINRNIESYRSKISKLEDTYEVLLAARNEDRANETKEERDKLKKRLQKLEKSLASKTGHVQGFQASEQRARRDILLNADVVCCTLNSCGSDTMLPLIPTKSTDANSNPNPRMPHFTCVIVDEAAQCVELDCLIPLQFRCSKMILVGDQKQLPPTVISKRALENNYNQSLFDRFYNYFTVSSRWEPPPIQVLDLQFRMHPEICRFPSQHFYKGQLKTDPKIQPTMEKFAYQHYLLFDIAYGAEQQEVAGELCNKMEADFVIELCEYLVAQGVQKVQPRNIGIITPYRKQKEVIRTRLRQRGQHDIDIGTVDGFQGREKDVIVLSCVRARNKAGTIGFLDDKRRMNVALTRAKYALYVIGRLSSLQVNSDWQQLIEDAKQRRLVVKVNSALDSRRVICENCKKPQPHRRTSSGK